MRKIFRFVFNENTDQFFMQKIFKFVFHENTDQFLYAEKF